MAEPLEETRHRPGLQVFSLCVLASGLLLIAVFVWLRPDSPEVLPRTATVVKKTAPDAAEQAPEPYVQPTDVPTRAQDDAQVARAMDLSNVRTLVRTLMVAAASRNQGQQTTMLNSLARYGSTARPILEEERATAADPSVVMALNQALQNAR